MRHHKFTLWELLCVVLVILVLLSLISSSMCRAMAMARLAICQSNLKNIGQGEIMYALTSKRIAGATRSGTTDTVSWDDMLAPYMGRNLTNAEIAADGLSATAATRIGNKVLVCPGDTVGRRPNNRSLRSYSCNNGQVTQGSLDKRGAADYGWGVILSTVVRPSDCVMMSERNENYANAVNNYTGGNLCVVMGSLTFPAVFTQGQWGSNDGVGNHVKGRLYRNFVFIDGHTEYTDNWSVWTSRLHWSGIPSYPLANPGN